MNIAGQKFELGTFVGEMYAIKHLPSGGYLPMPQKGKSVRGASHVEPEIPSKDNPIRLFPSKHAANIALRSYCMGKRKTIMHGGDGFGIFNDDYHEETVVVEGTQRSQADFKVVPICLYEGKLESNDNNPNK